MKRSFEYCPNWLALHLKEAGGEVPFSRFMDLALNDPVNGAYASGELSIGTKGDFVTSPSLGPEFCDLLSTQIVEWVVYLSEKNTGSLISIIDIGPGEGDLSFYLIEALINHAPELISIVEFVLIEINEGMKRKQKKKLSGLSEANIRWTSLIELTKRPLIGIMIAHEILDALPVDRIVLKKNNLFLQTVKLSTKHSINYINFNVSPLPENIKSSIQLFMDRFNIDIPPNSSFDGWNTEWHTSIPHWFDKTYSCLIEGKLLVIDYALKAVSYYHPSRNNGTIIAFSDQKGLDNILYKAGFHDITSHLCIESLLFAAERSGWMFRGDRKQGLALLSLGLSKKLVELQQLSNSEIEFILKSRENLLRLVEPSGLGSFRWLLFEKGVSFNNENTKMPKFLLDDHD